jgi:hypothetical protein
VDVEEIEGVVVVVAVGGRVVVVAGTVVEVVEDVVVVEGVTAGELGVVFDGGAFEGVVVGDETPFITPPRVVPALGPPKMDESELPAANSMTVTIPKATTNAARADASPIVARRNRLRRCCWFESVPAPVTGRTGVVRAEEDGLAVE